MGMSKSVRADFGSCTWDVFFFQAEDGIRDYKVTGVQTCALPIYQILRQKQALQEQLRPLQLERDRTGAGNAQVMKVTVQLASPTDANVQLTYQVRGPSWQPTYRAQLDPAKGTVAIERLALVAQNSGEDWSQVQLLLSTGQPSRSTPARLPNPWTLDVRSEER